MHIKLQSSVGDFDKSFMERLPALEKAMLYKGIDPSAFIIAKDNSKFPVPYIGYMGGGSSDQYDYTVFVGGESFTTTHNSDMSFLEEFYQHCIFPDEKESKAARLLKKTCMAWDTMVRWLKATPD